MTATIPEFKGTERFEVRELLGRGAVGIVYRAFDRQRKCEVALKTLARVEAESIYRFKKEFRALAELSHPNLASLYELISDGNAWFFTMELVPGLPFTRYVRGELPIESAQSALEASTAALRQPTGEERPQELNPRPGIQLLAPADIARLEAAAAQLASGVQALHAAGKLHRDIKPANVLVTPEGRVVLLDFGLVLARRDDYSDDPEDVRSGTPIFMAPERLAGRPATEASDWFSVGVMLYQALTGRYPFPSSSAVASATSPPPAVEGVPEEFMELVRALLDPSPHGRPTARRVLRTLGAEIQPKAGAPALGQVFVGRDEHLGRLRKGFEELEAGRPVRLQVRGASGFGKTTLVKHFLSELRDRGDTLVLSGRCHERESVPYKAFDALMDALVRYLVTVDPSTMARVLPEDVASLAQLFPVLDRVMAVHRQLSQGSASQDDYATARRASTALRELFRRLAGMRRLVIFIDDLQWGDLDSARLLADLLAPPNPPPFLLIVSYRLEDVVQQNPVLAHLLRAMGNADRANQLLDVAPLGADESRQLAERLLASRAGELVDAIAQEAAGSPFFVHELSRFVMEPLLQEHGSPMRVSLADVLRKRLEGLPRHAAELLETLALAGRPLAREVLVESTELGARAEDAFRILLNGSLIRSSGLLPTDIVETYHDRIREAAVESMPPERIRGCHLRMAEALERHASPDLEAVARHWLGAGKASRAAELMLQAADRASQALAFDRAVDLYRASLTLELPKERREPILVRLGTALQKAGRVPEAAEAYLAAAAAAPEERRVDLQRLACEQFLAGGHEERGRALARNVLRSVGLGMPSGFLSAVTALLGQRILLALRRDFDPKDGAAVDPVDRTRVDTCWSMATGLSMVDVKLGAIFSMRYLRYAAGLGEPSRLARALALVAVHVGAEGKLDEADRLLSRARELAQANADPHAEGLVTLIDGLARYFEGRWREALVRFDRAASIFRTAGAGGFWERSTASIFALWSLTYLGDWRDLARRGPEELEEARQRGNLYLSNWLRVSSGLIARLANDDLPGAEAEMEDLRASWRSDKFELNDFIQLYMGGWVDLYAGRGGRAYERMLEHWRALRNSLLLTATDVKLRMLHIRGYTAVARGGEAALSDALSCARGVARIRSSGAIGVAAVLRGAVAYQQGDPAKAIRELEEACLDFDKAQMQLYAAAARRRLAKLRPDGDSAARMAESDQAFAAQGIVAPERMAAVLAPGFD